MGGPDLPPLCGDALGPRYVQPRADHGRGEGTEPLQTLPEAPARRGLRTVRAKIQLYLFYLSLFFNK